jgi:hypothetical protein
LSKLDFPPLVGTMIGDVFQAAAQHTDLPPDHAPVRLELGLAGSAQPDAAANARQVGPQTREPRKEVLELRELYLHLCLVTARPGGEDVENYLGAIHDPHTQRLLQVGALHRR